VAVLSSRIDKLEPWQRLKALRIFVQGQLPKQQEREVQLELDRISKENDMEVLSGIVDLAEHDQTHDSVVRLLLAELAASEEYQASLSNAVSSAELAEPTSADPLTWFLLGSAVLVVISTKVKVKTDHVEVDKPGLKASQVAEFLRRLFQILP